MEKAVALSSPLVYHTIIVVVEENQGVNRTYRTSGTFG